MNQANDLQLLKFISKNKYYPHCRKVNTFSDLKSGVALAQIISGYIHEDFHHLLLPKIQTSSMTVQKSINNFKTILDTLQTVLSMDINMHNQMIELIIEFRAQNLYYKQKQLKAFITSVIMKLQDKASQLRRIKNQNLPNETYKKNQFTTYPSTIAAHQSLEISKKLKNSDIFKINQHQPIDIGSVPNQNNISQLSAIGNNQQSMILGYYDQNRGYPVYSTIIPHKDKSKKIEQPQQYIGQQDVEKVQINLPTQRLQKLQEWINTKLRGIEDKFQFNDDIRQQPDQLLGLLINSIFCKSRFNDPIIKQAQFLQGPIFVYRKCLNYLLNNPSADRLNKENALQMLNTIDQQNLVHQNQYWLLINDLYEFDTRKRGSSLKKNTHSKSLSKHKNDRQADKRTKRTQISQKQNIQQIINKKLPQTTYYNEHGRNIMINKFSSKKLLQTKASEKTIKTKNLKSQKMFDYPQSFIKQTEKWVIQELGYDYSLKKSQQKQSIYDNPLFNGSLIASIIMRLKVGRINLIKNPVNNKQVQTNWDQIVKICSLRGYECFKKLPLSSNKKYKTYIGILGQFYSEYKKFNPSKTKSNFFPKNSNKINDCNNCDPFLMLDPKNQPISHKQSLQWINSLNISIQSSSKISSSYIPVSIITEIFKKFFNLTILRETTKKIQQNNLQKILAQLRRLGISSYYNINTKNILCQQGIEYRWMIIQDIKWLVENKIQYSK